MTFHNLSLYYSFRTTVSLITALASGFAWAVCIVDTSELQLSESKFLLALFLTVLLFVVLYWQLQLYKQHARKVLFFLDAIENNDTSIHFAEDSSTPDSRLVNHAINRVAQILYQVKTETAQQEKYYELILNCVDTGIIVLNDKGVVCQKNNGALHLLGTDILTHIVQLERIDKKLANLLKNCHAGNKLQVPICNERGTRNLAVHVSEIMLHGDHLRILALNDIHNELDEKEIDSWTKLTKVLTHEIMNSVTPITSLSKTLLQLAKDENKINRDELQGGLQTICATSQSLMAFVESYRQFTHIPSPIPELFYVKDFTKRMISLARHQYPNSNITFLTEITPDDLILYADENLISQVMTNLLKNAVQAIESENKDKKEKYIRIHAYCNEEEAVVIEITNNGPPIPPDIENHIFVPFFTTREKGSGVGLSISRQIMRLSGGSLTLKGDEKETTFVLKFN
ncbi:ATP-binding protein [uncultured Bacteroides sp.]|uniref:sensor histidine kinase n=1 Tax=uncultured Bacteroides sp. TaxID=162156 RepID=UPI002601E12B|nr:ATP-binding protein [uncultured Bacteroides sp.]